MKPAAIERGRAKFALDAVKSICDTPNDKTKKEYKSYAKKFPSLVMSNGLAAAVAFAIDKGGTWGIIYNNVSKWLIEKGYLAESVKLEEYVCSLDSGTYRVVTNEVLALFEWMRRFASGLIEGEADE